MSITKNEAVGAIIGVVKCDLIHESYKAELKDIAAAIKDDLFEPKWIPVGERLPDLEVEVLITTKKIFQAMYGEEQTAYFTCLAFYEDGTIWTEDSDYNFDTMDNCPYDEEQEDWKIPQGWWEGVTYSEEFKEVDDEVVAWMPKPKPYKEEQNG